MDAAVTFLGAARNVTGSRYLVRCGDRRILVDCGLYQERQFQDRNYLPFSFPPRELDAVVLTHAHLDHCGLLPRLARMGFAGPVHGTAATLDIARIVLRDSARLQAEDLAFKRARHAREGRRSPHSYEPLYEAADVENCVKHMQAAPYGQAVDVAPGITASFHESGHILGSSSVALRLTQGGAARTVVFSGDIGQWGAPIVRDPTTFVEADYVTVESTYGDRLHGDNRDIPAELARVVNETVARGGNLVIPSFAVERSQELVFHLHNLLRADRIPHLLVFVDSPMAVQVTEVFRRHPELFDEETRAMLARGEHPCDFPGLVMCRSVEQSKAINRIRGSAVIIAGAGMCTGGRIKHHLASHLGDPRHTVLFVGYQASGTLGRLLVDGSPRVRIFGEQREVRARIERISGFSAHADRDALWRWLSGLRGPRGVFVTHGEENAATAFGALVRERTSWQVAVPSFGEEHAIG